jgi:hypothetical protein
MTVMKEYREAVPQGKAVGNSRLKELLLHVARQVWPKFKRRAA